MKKLLILNGSLSEATLIEEAKKLGYYTITSGNNPSLLGHALADEYIPADYSDKEAILKIVKENNIDCIVSCANDFGVITSCYVAEKMGWPGHDTYENALIMHQKDLFKEFIQKLGLRTPVSKVFESYDEAAEYVKTVEYPIIVKANDLTGGKGILRANNEEEALFAIKNAIDRSRTSRFVIEPFIVGNQQSIVTFVKDKKVIASVTCDCFSPINPYLIQSELLFTDTDKTVENELHESIEKICDTLDLKDGIFTLQYIVSDGKPYIIEMMRRCLGNQFLTVAHAVTGFPWEEALVKAEIGEDLSNLKWEKPLAKYAGHHGIMVRRNGKIKGYIIPEELQKHIFKIIDILKPYEEIDDYMNQRVAYIYYKYDDKQEALDTIKRMNDIIKVEFAD